MFTGALIFWRGRGRAGGLAVLFSRVLLSSRALGAGWRGGGAGVGELACALIRFQPPVVSCVLLLFGRRGVASYHGSNICLFDQWSCLASSAPRRGGYSWMRPGSCFRRATRILLYLRKPCLARPAAYFDFWGVMRSPVPGAVTHASFPSPQARACGG